MTKIHLRVDGVDCRKQGQTEHEFTHQAACGYVRDNITTNFFEVTCFFCKKTKEFDKQENCEGE